ncbi:hypothetical protein OG782_36845 [Streptomyces sp. NBC_00876]|uniref:hypothetical protein n=1 Tax=Streptomyces sp. NBC_00876 TaxID=2975853 RepID=UPI00386A0940|nr:hypothetical protein OG782_36845 [Streptomyces sp. NBC_00876]
MARDIDDDAPRRIGDAKELVLARRWDSDERIYVVTTNLVIDAQEQIVRRRQLDRMWRAGAAISWLSLLAALSERASPGAPRAMPGGSSWAA